MWSKTDHPRLASTVGYVSLSVISFTLYLRRLISMSRFVNNFQGLKNGNISLKTEDTICNLIRIHGYFSMFLLRLISPSFLLRGS